MSDGHAWAALLRPVGDALAGTVAGTAVNALLGLVLAAHDTEMKAILRVEGKVDQLLSGPFNAGVTWLEEAHRAHRTPDERTRDLELARQAFVNAQSQLVGYARAVSQTYLAITYALIGQEHDSTEWLRRAAQSADSTVCAAVDDAARRHGSLLAGSFGRARGASRRALRALNKCKPLIDEINGILRIDSPPTWSYELEEWEEEVFTGGAGEQHDSVWQTATRRGLQVTRNGETWSLDAP